MLRTVPRFAGEEAKLRPSSTWILPRLRWRGTAAGGGGGIFQRAGICLGTILLPTSDAFAHAADRGHVLLLPTGYYLIGGAAAVALTFVVLALIPPQPLDRLARLRLPIGAMPTGLRFVGSLASFLFLLALLAIGFIGSRDPLSNPLPLMVWTIFWVGLTLLQGLLGNLWWWIDPWYAPWRMLRALIGSRASGEQLPSWLGYWPAVALFLGFAWFELVYPAPDDPARLATVLGVYFVANLSACLVFGHEAWTRQGECLSVFMGMIARLAIVRSSPDGKGRRAISLCLPGAKLVDAEPLPLSGALFLLLALSSVSFDGLMRTFFWFGLNGLNPLEFPGRTAVMGINSAGLLGMFFLLVAVFFAAIILGERLSGRPVGVVRAAGALVWSIIPISMAYHFSHYLTALAINGQYALAALSDPLMSGRNLFGTAGMHVQAGVTMGAESAWVIWNLQAAAIIGGHLLAVTIAHTIAYRLYDEPRAAAVSQLGLAGLMVAYTVFGLWLLSSPTAA